MLAIFRRLRRPDLPSIGRDSDYHLVVDEVIDEIDAAVRGAEAMISPDGRRVRSWKFRAALEGAQRGERFREEEVFQAWQAWKPGEPLPP